ncbi:uncharacterized protein TNCV_1267621 [Trichonephila clavipes]|nr:uncharacterized protein TNCV_1267621 [Trichonephila clavipes]
MPNSLSQIIPDMLDWKQIWRSGRSRNGSKSNGITPAVGAVCCCKVKVGLRSSPRGLHTQTRLSSPLRLNLYSSLKTTCFHSAAVQFPRARHRSKRKRRWMVFKGSACNGSSDPKCPLARCLRMVRKDTKCP